jgi:hypothetical protein
MVRSPGTESEDGAGSAILRVDKCAGRWEAVPRQLIEDQRLELDTRALAVWLIARPEGWEIRAGALPQLLKNRSKHVGRERVQRMLRELETNGYLTRSCYRTADGRWRWHAVFSLIPRRVTVDGLAVDGSTVNGSAVNGKPVDIRNTEGNNTEENNTEENNTVRNNTQEQSTQATATDRGTEAANTEFNIELPKCLRGPQRGAAKRFLAGCPVADRQSVLDEIAAMDAQGRVRRPIGLLRKLVENATAGTFAPSAAKPKSGAPSREFPLIEPRGGRIPGQTSAGLEEAVVIARRALAKLRAKHGPGLDDVQREGEAHPTSERREIAPTKKGL